MLSVHIEENHMSKASEYVAAEWMRRYDEMKDQRDQLREALHEVMNTCIGTGEELRAFQKARAALAATEEGK